MTVRIGDIVIDCADPRLAAEFWCAALGYRITETDETGVAAAGDSSAPTLLFLVSDDPKPVKNRIHFDVCPTEGTTRDDEVARLEALGATRVDTGQSGGSWVRHGGSCRQRVLRDEPRRATRTETVPPPLIHTVLPTRW